MRLFILSAFLCTALACLSCRKETPTSIPEPRESISFISPSDSAIVLESATIEIQVSSERPVSFVVLTIDGSIVNKRVFDAPPYKVEWQTDTLPEGSSHELDAKAYFNDGTSLSSSPRHVTVYHFTPSNLSAQMVNDTLLNLVWKDNSSKETSFDLQESINGNPFASLEQMAANTTSASVSGKYSIGDSLAFRIRAMKDTLASNFSNTASVSIVFPAPSNLLLLSLTDTEVQLSWKDNAAFGSGFIIEQSTDGTTFTTIASVGRNASPATVSDTFGIDSTHYFRVRARSTINTSGGSNVVSAMLHGLNMPAGLSITGLSSDSLILHWTGNTDYTKGYAIERQISGGQWKEVQRVGAAVSLWMDPSVDTASVFSYRIRAFTSIHYSSYSQNCAAHFGFDNNAILSINSNNAGGNNMIWKFLFSPDGTALMCATGLQTNLYSLSTGALLHTYGRFASAAAGLALSRDGSIVMAFGVNDSTVTAWNVSSGTQIMSCKEETWMLNDMDISADAAFFAICGVDRLIGFRSISTGALIREIPGTNSTNCLVFNPAGDLLVAGTSQSTVQMIRVSDGTILHTLAGFNFFVNSVSFNSAGTLFATGSDDHSVKLWDLNGTLIASYAGNTDYVRSVALNPAGTMIASGGYDPYIRIWGISDGVLLRTLPGHTGGTTVCRFSPNGKYFASGGYDFHIRIYKAFKEWLGN